MIAPTSLTLRAIGMLRSYRIYNSEFTNIIQNRSSIYVLDAILNRMLFENIREEQELVYSIGAAFTINHYPKPYYNLLIY